MSKSATSPRRRRNAPAGSPADRRLVEKGPSCPIVGLGASAGGLEALEQFLRHVADGSGFAFVIVQHLDPTHKGVMPQLLQRFTSMKVVQARDRMRVKPDGVYVIPPNKDMSVLHGRLYLFEPTAPRGLRLPVDFFFRSLADDRQEESIGVLLSGMGSDGTLGGRAIKEKGGLLLVQDPLSAKFDSMPRSAIDAGLADIVAPTEDLPGKIIAYRKHTRRISKGDRGLATSDRSALEKIIVLLRAHSGQDFSLYKKGTVYRRVQRRMGIQQIDGIASYARYLQENAQEVELLAKEMLVGVTSFFRDPGAWDLLGETALPTLLSEAPDGRALRAWSAGCSTGEEAYSLGIVFQEALDRIERQSGFSLQIFATDMDRESIDHARRGIWPANIAAAMSPDRLRRFFVREGNGYRVSKGIREMVTFATQNAITDPPFIKLDILVCRNLLIYLTPQVQKKLIPRFHYSLNPGGLLFLGNSETVGAAAELFVPLDARSRIYRRSDSAPTILPEGFPAYSLLHREAGPGVTVPETPSSLQFLTEQVLLTHHTPPAVLVNNKGDILYINGHTGKYLELAAGKANWNIFAMAREGLRSELSRAFRMAIRGKRPVTVAGRTVTADGGRRPVNIVVQVLQEPAALRGLALIVFTDLTEPSERNGPKRAGAGAAGGATIEDLQKELRLRDEELQLSREEVQMTLEELNAANEELQSANEELHSANEELSTSQEEMQSLNEEMQTVNAEQQARLDEFERMNDDMKNLLDSTEIVTVFLDGQLSVRRFTHGAAEIFKLLPTDVGRPLTDITSTLLYTEMPEDAREVLRTLVRSEKPVATTDGRWFSVRIMPYRTTENVIDGVVITFVDISAAKTLELQLRAAVTDASEGGRDD